MENKLDDQGSARHRNIKNADYKERCLPTVIFPVDVNDRKDDEIGVDKRDYTAKANSTVPKDSGERDIADRADERKDRDQWSDEWPPQCRSDRMRREEKRIPKVWRHPGAERTGDE